MLESKSQQTCLYHDDVLFCRWEISVPRIQGAFCVIFNIFELVIDTYTYDKSNLLCILKLFLPLLCLFDVGCLNHPYFSYFKFKYYFP